LKFFITKTNDLSFLQLESNSRLVLTDWGGVQEETCIFWVPCVTLRDNTERPETVEVGSNMLAGINPDKILEITTINTTGGIHLPHTLNEYGRQSFWAGKTRWLFLKKHPTKKAKLATIGRAMPALILTTTAITSFLNSIISLTFATSWLALIMYHYANSPSKKLKRIVYLVLRFTYNSFSYTIGLLKGFIDLYIKGVINTTRGK